MGRGKGAFEDCSEGDALSDAGSQRLMIPQHWQGQSMIQEAQSDSARIAVESVDLSIGSSALQERLARPLGLRFAAMKCSVAYLDDQSIVCVHLRTTTTVPLSCPSASTSVVRTGHTYT